jgi:hypothetical protein
MAPLSPLILDVSADYAPLVTDALRMATIQITIQLMYWAVDDAVPLLSADFLLLLMFVLLGVGVYHLVVSKLLRVA